MDLDFALYPYFHTFLQPVASSNIKFIQRQGFVRKFTIPWKTTNMNTLYYMLSLSI